MKNKDVWDKVLTDAICETNGRIQPYDKILKFFATKFELRKKRDRKKV